MAVRKRGGSRNSTPLLVFWGVAMLLLGLGLGLLLTNQGCGKRRTKGAEKQEPAPMPSPRKTKPPARSPENPAHPEGAGRAEATKKVEPKPEPKTELPRMAIVIDDFGYAPPELVRRLCAQPIPFSAAVLPFQEFTQESARIAHEAGKEIMLHLPMEPIGFPGPGKNPGPEAVMFDQPESEMRARVKKALLDVPWRKGVNNHMGSRITPDKQRMTWILQEIKRAGCFFVDSRTEKESVAYDVAEALKIPSVQRKVFLDDDKSFEAMAKQWERALAIARKEGQVLIIGHVYPETVEALEKLVPRAKGQVTFVRASELAK
jgi:polysaccharide deacetylase 2 family uncharacterized protein YibQ